MSPTRAPRVARLVDGPILGQDAHPSIGENIQGPSLIRVPDWMPSPLGRYYLYFADHKGRYIRLAYADRLEGPWQVHVPGSLRLEDSLFPTEPPEAPPELIEYVQKRIAMLKLPHDAALEITTPHIASPDVHVDADAKRIVMYYHGLEGPAYQVTRVATSRDGLHFEARPEVLGLSYFRVFRHRAHHYALAMPGQLYRSADGLSGFEEGPRLFGPDMRHAALRLRGDTLQVFYTQVGEAPERILLSTIDLSSDWTDWKNTEPVEVLRPERPWEGADAPLEPSLRSVAYGHQNQLRDPAIYEEDRHSYLLYAVAGERGIAIAELTWGD